MADFSAEVGSILASYRDLIVTAQKMVTGHPNVLNAKAQEEQQRAEQIKQARDQVKSTVDGLGAKWTGSAHDAFAALGADVIESLGTQYDQIREQVSLLQNAARLIQNEMTKMQGIMTTFDGQAQQLIALSQCAAEGTRQLFLARAKEIGEKYARDAKFSAYHLDEQLGLLLDGLPHQRKAGKLMKDKDGGPLSKVDGDGYLGSGDDRPKGPNSAYWDSKWRSFRDKDGYFTTTKPPKDSSTPFGDHSKDPWWSKYIHIPITSAGDPNTVNVGPTFAQYDSFRQVTTSGDADLYYRNKYYVGGQNEFTVNPVNVDYKGVSGGIEEKFSVLQGSTEGQVDWHNLRLNGSLSGEVKAELGVDGMLGYRDGVYGAGLSAHGFAGGEVEGKIHGDVGGLGAGASGSLMYGYGGQADGQLVYENGHLKGNLKLGLAAGWGGSLGANVDLDLPRIGRNVEYYTGWDVNGTVSHAADGMSSWWKTESQSLSNWWSGTPAK